MVAVAPQRVKRTRIPVFIAAPATVGIEVRRETCKTTKRWIGSLTNDHPSILNLSFERLALSLARDTLRIGRPQAARVNVAGDRAVLLGRRLAHPA
jgi:hypothetical protein